MNQSNELDKISSWVESFEIPINLAPDNMEYQQKIISPVIEIIIGELWEGHYLNNGNVTGEIHKIFETAFYNFYNRELDPIYKSKYLDDCLCSIYLALTNKGLLKDSEDIKKRLHILILKALFLINCGVIDKEFDDDQMDKYIRETTSFLTL